MEKAFDTAGRLAGSGLGRASQTRGRRPPENYAMEQEAVNRNFSTMLADVPMRPGLFGHLQLNYHDGAREVQINQHLENEVIYEVESAVLQILERQRCVTRAKQEEVGREAEREELIHARSHINERLRGLDIRGYEDAMACGADVGPGAPASTGPDLGLATTAQLAAELNARISLGHGADPNYRTVD